MTTTPPTQTDQERLAEVERAHDEFGMMISDADIEWLIETVKRLQAQVAEARGHNGANVHRGTHPVHPNYGTCDAFADGGACSECVRVLAAQGEVVQAARELSPIWADHRAIRKALDRLDAARG